MSAPTGQETEGTGTGVTGRRAAVAGRPIGHSLSPVLHRAAYAALGLPWSYEAIDCGREELADLIARVRSAPEQWAGLSLTMPLKEAVVPLLDRVETDVGAVNTVAVGAGGELVGYNTDVDGILGGLHELCPAGIPPSVALLGAGGTARAAAAALAGVCQELTIHARDAGRAEQVAQLARARGLAVRIAPFGPPALGLPVIVTLPTGVADRLPPTGPVLDVLYDPWPTAYAAAARAAGYPVVGGLVVLAAQAARQVTLMTGQHVPIAALRRAVGLSG